MIVVPFDGSELSALALRRANVMAAAFDAQVEAVTVIPNGADYARSHDWLDDAEPFDADRIASRLRDQVANVSPAASYHVERVASHLPRGSIAKRLKRFARERDADVVFIGSENAGRVVTPISSVGSSVAADEHYDVYIVRNRRDYLATDD